MYTTRVSVQVNDPLSICQPFISFISIISAYPDVRLGPVV